MKPNDKCGIYSIKHRTTDRVYIGSSSRIYSRWNQHRNALQQNKSVCRLLQKAYNEDGLQGLSFAVVEECSKEQLLERERFWIEALQPELNLVKDPTRRGNYLDIAAEISKANKGRKNPHTVSDAQKEAIRQAHLGKKLSVEAITKRTATRKKKAEEDPQYHEALAAQARAARTKRSYTKTGPRPEVNKKISAAKRASGYSHSEETRMKISQAQLGKKRGPMSPQHRAKIGAANRMSLPSDEDFL
jgi:group I intron endonuclease